MKKQKNKYILIYFIIMILIGLYDYIDWYFISVDPIWHIYIYIYIIPILSFLLGLIESNKKYYYIYPILSILATSFIYIFMENGGFSIDKGIIIVNIFSFISTIIGIILGKLIIYIKKSKGS